MTDIILILAVALYAIRVLAFKMGCSILSKKNRLYSGTKNEMTVSVVIPARNEERIIADCIRSVAASDYPLHKYEIIAVNDRSTDRTGAVMDEMKAEIPNLRVKHISSETAHKNLRGKPGALQAGIDLANNDIIMMTDADCIVKPGWIRHISRIFADDEIGIVPSFTTIRGDSIFERITAVESIFLHTMAAGAIGIGSTLGAYGNNMAIRKSDFNKVGGYKSVRFSVTEDLAMLQAIRKSGKKAHYLLSYESSVETHACKNMKEYLSQHHRWAVGGTELGWRAAFFVTSTLVQWLGLIAAIASDQFLWLVAILGVRLAGDFWVIAPSLKALRKNHLKLWVFPSILFLMLFEPVIPLTLLKRDVVWKDQVFRKEIPVIKAKKNQ